MSVNVPAGGPSSLFKPDSREAKELSVQVDRFIANPPPAQAYNQVTTGPEIEIGFEPNEALPVDGSNKLLRRLSPFVIRFEPPLAYDLSPSALDKNNNKKGTGIFDAAGRSAGRNGFTSARQFLRNATYINNSVTTAARGEYVSLNSGDRYLQRGSSKEGLVMSDRGDVSGSGNLGKPAIADVLQAYDIASQLNAILRTPPLILLINPQSSSISTTKIQQFQERTRYGFVFQAWGEDQPRLSVSLRCGGFLSAGRGLTPASRRDSASWQNMMTLFQFYRNNGYIYDLVGRSNAHLFVGAVSIHYDQWSYFGHFQSFTYSFEEAQETGGITVSFDFTISRMLDHSEPVVPEGGVGAVRPLVSPNPDPMNPRFSSSGAASINRPGEFSFQYQSGTGNVILSEQGRNVLQGGRIVTNPAEATSSIPTSVSSSLPVSGGGFRTPTQAPAPSTLPAGSPTPFRI